MRPRHRAAENSLAERATLPMLWGRFNEAAA